MFRISLSWIEQKITATIIMTAQNIDVVLYFPLLLLLVVVVVVTRAEGAIEFSFVYLFIYLFLMILLCIDFVSVLQLADTPDQL